MVRGVVPDRPTDPPEAEPRVCGTCYYYDPCPCGRCGWGVCRDYDRRRMPTNEYMPDDGYCREWREA